MEIKTFSPAKRRWLAAASALLLILSFPNPIFVGFFVLGPWFALVALVPLLFACEGLAPKQAAKLGFLTGFLFNSVSLIWINNVRPMGPAAVPAWLVLSAYSALYVSAFAALFARGIKDGWRWPLIWAPALWTLLEFAREHVMDGFTWASLGSSQYASPLLPLARVGGVMLLHFFTAAVSLVIWAMLRKAEGFKKQAVVLGMALIVLMSLALLWKPKVLGKVKTAVIQINIDPDQQWDEEYRDLVMGLFTNFIGRAKGKGADVIVWPETDFPGIYNFPSKEADLVRDISQAHDLTMLVGSNEGDGEGSYYNSSFLVEPGTPLNIYRKRHLVAFGEYIPLRWLMKLIPGVNMAVERLGGSDFLRGDKAVVFESRRGKFAPLICWETVFSQEAYEAVDAGAEVLVLQTYDGWFGVSAAPYYLTAQAAIRAVESGRWVVRSATTGISGFFDWKGNFHGLLGLQDRGPSVMQVERLSGKTPYLLGGNWFVWLCLFLVFGAALSAKSES